MTEITESQIFFLIAVVSYVIHILIWALVNEIPTKLQVRFPNIVNIGYTISFMGLVIAGVSMVIAIIKSFE